MMRRIQSERAKPAGPQRISVPEAQHGKRRGSEGSSGWAKNLIRRISNSNSGEPGKRASVEAQSFVCDSDEELSEGGYRRFDVGTCSEDFLEDNSSQQSNYAPKNVGKEKSLESTAAAVLYHSGNAGITDDSFNEEVTTEFACMRDRIVASHIKLVHHLVTEKNRLQKELSRRRESKRTRSKESAKIPSDVACRKEHDDLGRSEAMHVSLTREGQDAVGLAVSSSPRTKSEISSSRQQSPWGSNRESPRNSRLQSPQNSRPQTPQPSQQASHSRNRAKNNAPNLRSNSEEASQEPVQSNGSNGIERPLGMHDAPPLLTEPQADTIPVVNGFSSVCVLDDQKNEKAPDVASGLSVMRRPPVPPEGTPEPPANLPCVLPGVQLGNNDLDGFSDISGVMAIASLQSDGPVEEKTEGILHNESERTGLTERTERSSSPDSSQHPDEKFELWGIWMKNKAPATRRHSVNSRNKECVFGDRNSLDPFGGDRASATHARQSSDGVTVNQNSSGSFLLNMLPSMQQDEYQSATISRSTKIRRRFSRRLVLTPSSLKHIFWELIGLQLIVYDAILIPLSAFDLPSSSILTAIAFVICVFRSLDLLKKFLTGFVRNEGTIELDPIKVARRYVRSWLALDAGCTTCDWISLSKSETVTLLEMARMLRMLRLISVAPELERLVTEHMMSLGNADIVNLISSVVKSIILLLAVSHFVACAWYAFGEMAFDAHGTSWVQQLEESATLWERYAWSLHWSLGQFVGELVFLPTCSLERSFALAVLLFALLFSALFVSTITTAMTRLQILAGKQASQMAVLRRYLSDNNISASLTVRVLRNAEHSCHSTKKNVPEKRIEMLNIISEPLRVELNYEVHFPILAVHPWFERYQTVNPAGLRKVCHVAVKIQPLQRGDVVFCDCETPVWPRMFFVVSGRFAYMHETHAEKLLTHGGWASEAVLWTRWMHCGTLTAGADSVLASLDAEKFTSIVSPFPTPHAIVYGQRFVSDLNSIDRHLVTDLSSDRTEELVDLTFRSVGAVRGKDYNSTLQTRLSHLRHSATTMLGNVPNIRNSTGSRHSRQQAQAARGRNSRTSNYSNSPVRRLKSETGNDWESEC